MWDGDLELTRDGSHIFNFTSSGFFTLVDRTGAPLYNKVFPLFIKATSHLIWSIMWLVIYLGLSLFFTLPKVVLLIFLGLLVFHSVCFLFRMVKLLMIKGVRPLISPPKWIKVTRRLQKGADLSYLEEQKLNKHPGLLANLALLESLRGNPTAAKYALQLAIKLCPDHVALNKLYHHLASQKFTMTTSCDLT